MAGTSRPGWSNANQKKRVAIIAAAIKKFPDIPARTLGRKLHDENPLLFPSAENARTAVRAHLGVNGPTSKKVAEKHGRARLPRKPGEIPQLPPLPESAAKPWKPHVFDVVGDVGILSDIHLPYQDNRAIEVALSHLDTLDLAGILINGDLLDFYQISRFDKDPTKPKILAELEACNAFFAHLRARFGDLPIVYKAGNHDERMDLYLAASAPELFDIPAIRNAWYATAGIVEHKIEVVKDKRPVMLGKLPVLHGHEKGQGISSPVNQARGAFLRIGQSVLEGHGHRSSSHSEPTGISREETMCWSTGCLCDLSPNFAVINKWNHGFAVVTVHKGGEFDVRNLRISKDYKVRES